MKKLIINFFLMYFLILVLNVISFSQECVMEDEAINNRSFTCNTSISNLFFLPDINEPIKTVRLNFIFLQKDDDGTGNFEENNSEHQQYINDVINELNLQYSNLINSQNCYSGTLFFLNNSKIQFKVNKIYVKDTFGWDNNSNLCPDNSNWYLNYLHNEINSNTNFLPAINVFFTEYGDAYDEIVFNNNCDYPFLVLIVQCTLLTI